LTNRIENFLKVTSLKTCWKLHSWENKPTKIGGPKVTHFGISFISGESGSGK
jgi:hypothetical protein